VLKCGALLSDLSDCVLEYCESEEISGGPKPGLRLGGTSRYTPGAMLCHSDPELPLRAFGRRGLTERPLTDAVGDHEECRGLIRKVHSPFRS
jgi:hypothetical protein